MKRILIRSFRIAWVVLILLLFALYSGTISHTYGSSLSDWTRFIRKLLEMDIFAYGRDLLPAYAGAVLFTLACASVGSIFINLAFREKQAPPSERIGRLITAFILGEIVFSVVLIGLGMAAQFTPRNTAIVVLIGGAAGIMPLGKFILARAQPENEPKIKETSKFWIAILGLSITAIFAAALLSSARVSYDSTALYFSNAKLSAMTHRLAFFPNDVLMVSSFHTGILYAALVQIAGDQSARLLSWMNGLLIVLMSVSLADALGLSDRGKRLVVVLLVTSTAFLDPFGDGKIELSATLPALAAVYWLAKTAKDDGFGNYLLAGICAGLAIIARPYNLILLGGFIGIFFFTQTTPLKSRVRSYFVLGLPVLALLIFHLTVNWALLGDFFAPINDSAQVRVENWQWSGLKPGELWLARILYPFTVTFFNSPQSLGTVTPLAVMFIPFFIQKGTFKKSLRSGELKTLVLISLFLLPAWITFNFMVVEIRYVFFLWILVFLAAAEMMSVSLEQMPPATYRLFSAAIVLTLIYTIVRAVFVAVDAYSPIDQTGAPQCNDSAFCDYLAPLNEAAAPGGRVLVFSAFRYYLRPDLFACSSKAGEYHEIRGALEISSDEFWKAAYRNGYTYIAYEENYSLRHLGIKPLPAIENAPDWVKLRKLSETFGGYFIAFEIEYVDAPFQSQRTCVNREGIWAVVDE
jgi:hypothetical protein